MAVVVGEDVLDPVARYWDSELSRLAFFSPWKAIPSSRAPLRPRASSLWIARWLVDATPTRLPASISRAISRPDVYVFPEPGGPWITRCRPSSDDSSAVISSMSFVWTSRSNGSRRNTDSIAG